MKLQTFFLMVFSVVALGFTEGGSQLQPDKFDVRVLLAKAERSDVFEWTLKSPNGFFLRDPDDGTIQEIKGTKITVSFKQGRITINRRRLVKNGVELVAKSGETAFMGNRYAGFFALDYASREGLVHLVNHVDIEDYLYSVLRWESWPGWPLEVNKALTIACRTFLVKKILDSRREKEDGSFVRSYDIRATNMDQTYKGIHEFVALRKALEETRGIVMTFGGKPIEAMYDTCCGGVVPADLEGVDFVKAPYLKRDYACTYCKNCSLYTWKVIYRTSDFKELIRAGIEDAVPVRDIRILRRDKAHVVREVQVKTNSAWIALSGQKIYSLLKDIKSLCFSLKRDGNKIIATGHGCGHHLGLCQWGAREMVRQGWNYKEVLEFFYPGISFTSIKVVYVDKTV
ncbi:TPA: hypothetical protein DDZ86_02960 [Candidatus Dependentiae bacterium]|nr:MAG: Sporulation protein SpoIID-like protein [candidate division TM6 bacterium GW2011_GWF2_43_87]HBL98579.1 hypothetical protein [Candidatus Dependentiae bacterium]